MKRREPKVVLRLSHDLFCDLRSIVRLAIIDAEQHIAWLAESGSAENFQKSEQWLAELKTIQAEMKGAAEKWMSAPALSFARLEKRLERIQSGKLTKAERKRLRKICAGMSAP